MGKQLKWVELMFNFHRRFLRGPDKHPGYEREHFINIDPENRNESWSWMDKDEAYQVGFSLGSPEGVPLPPGCEAMYVSAPKSKPNFSVVIPVDQLKTITVFPFSLIDMDIFEFGNTDRIAGRLQIKNEGTHFEVLANFVTLPPYVFNEYEEKFIITTNEEFVDVVNKLNRLFAEVLDREY